MNQPLHFYSFSISDNFADEITLKSLMSDNFFSNVNILETIILSKS